MILLIHCANTLFLKRAVSPFSLVNGLSHKISSKFRVLKFTRSQFAVSPPSSVCATCVSTQQSCSLCLPGPKVKRWECLTRITAVTGAASPWSQPRPPTPAEIPTQSLELLSNPSLSPLILLDKVSTSTSAHRHTLSGHPITQCNCRAEQLLRGLWICGFSLQLVRLGWTVLAKLASDRSEGFLVCLSKIKNDMLDISSTDRRHFHLETLVMHYGDGASCFIY